MLGHHVQHSAPAASAAVLADGTGLTAGLSKSLRRAMIVAAFHALRMPRDTVVY
jgi:hypothetical protein